MGEVLSTHVKFEHFPTRSGLWTTFNAFELLSVTAIFTLLIWYMQFHWNRRKIYYHAAKLPGPVGYPLIGSVLEFIGEPYEIFVRVMRMFHEYPDIFRVWFGHRCFFAVSSPKYYEIILPNCLQKERWYNKVDFLVGEGLFTASYKKWKTHRKLISPTFNQKILDSFVDIFNEQSEILVEQMKKYAGKGEFDLFHMVSKCTLDIICETAMGVKVNAQTTDSLYTTWVDKALEAGFLKCFVWWYHISSLYNLTNLAKEVSECTRNIHEFSGKVVREKMLEFEEMQKHRRDHPETWSTEELPRKKAFLDYLLEVTHSENAKLTEKQLRDEVDTFIIAGSDTTATTNCFIFTMLGLHQKMQQKVYEEVIDVIGLNRPVEPGDLPRLKYLERFIKETLRIFPVAGIILREVEQDVDIGDYIIPAGVSVIFGILETHTNPKYWPDPFKFDPDRFLPEEVAKRHPCCYIPFSYGPRNCIGPKYAMMTMKSLVATVIRRYKIFTSYEKVQDVKMKCSLIMRAKNGYKVFVEDR